MDTLRHTLICTVGTSLKSNLEKNPERWEWLNLLSQGRLKELAKAMITLPPDDRLLGAEINSIASIITRGLLKKRVYLHLLVSDTEDGQATGEVLKYYYLDPRNPYNFENVMPRQIVGLTDVDPRRFQREGLRHLVTAVADIARQRGPEQVVINATGGYKAQISFAGLIGQALDIPVCYLFERFSDVITLPPQPVSLDLSFWLAHASWFYQLAQDKDVSDQNLADPRFSSLVEEIDVEGQKLVALTAMGQLFHETFRYRFERQRNAFLPPDAALAPEGKRVHYESGLGPRPPGIETWFNKILEVPYVTGIRTFYYNPRLPMTNYFRPSSRGEVSQLEGGFSDGKATAKFAILTTARNNLERDAALADLCERFLTN